MKVFINGEIHDSEETYIVLVFDNDDDRQCHANNLFNMQPKSGKRMYAAYPQGKYSPDQIESIFKELEQ